MKSFKSNYPYSNLKRKFKLTAFQLSAFFILPLFVFALFIKVRERRKIDNSVEITVSHRNFSLSDYTIQIVSQPVIDTSESRQISDSAK